MPTVGMTRRLLVTASATAGVGAMEIDAAFAQKKPVRLRDDAPSIAPQLIAWPKGDDKPKHVVEAYVSITCNICYEFMAQVAAPLLQAAELDKVAWVFTHGCGPFTNSVRRV